MYHHKNGIHLRKVEDEDLEDLKDLRNDSWSTQHDGNLINQRDQDRWFDNLNRTSLHLVACSPNPAGIVSITFIDDISRSAMVGGAIRRECRGTEVTRRVWEAMVDFPFEMLNLRRIGAEVLSYNLAAMRLDLSLGFVVEGRKRQAVYRGGEYHDSIVIGMLREEWEQCPRVKNYGGICNKDYKKRKHKF